MREISSEKLRSKTAQSRALATACNDGVQSALIIHIG